MIRTYGADLPYADLRRGRTRGMDGYFWRLSDPASGRVLVVLCGVCRLADGGVWGNLGVAAHPGGFLRYHDVPAARAARDRFEVWAGDGANRLHGGPDGVRIELGPEARVEARLTPRHSWARPLLGGLGAAHLLPGLNQYWHPHLLGAEVRGEAVLGSETISLDGWNAYGEHNWGRDGFPARWWWGQAQGFDRPDVCVAFAGGDVAAGPVRTQATAVVVALGGRVLRLGNPLIAPIRVSADASEWDVRGRGPLSGVELHGGAPAADAHLLPVPILAQRRSLPGAREHLAATLSLKVRRRGRILYAGESRVAGLEVSADGDQ